MDELIMRSNNGSGISDDELFNGLKQMIQPKISSLKKVLVLPPDFTRMHSGAGKITAMLYDMLHKTCKMDILPALGTHEPMTPAECEAFFGKDVPFDIIIEHNWRNDVVKLGEIPQSFVNEVSEGLVNNEIDVEVNRRIVDKSYDLVISVGQVVPHEVVGMANYSKNIFVGCGGSNMINQSHMLGAFYGMERILGRDFSPVRKVFDYAEQNFIKDVPLLYILTVTTQSGDTADIHGVFAGRDRKYFEQAVKLSQEKNLTYVEKPLKKVVVYLDEREFKSTWLGNKAVYRTRMAIEDGGELIILAPGVRKFGEDEQNDTLIRKYGYVGRKDVLKLCDEHEELRQNLSVAAHLIHGSSDDRFSITYASDKLSEQQVHGVNFGYMPLADALGKYNPQTLNDGFNILPDGEEIYYISNPALGLWIDANRL